MIAAQHMVPNTSSAHQIKVVGNALVGSPAAHTVPEDPNDKLAVSGTKFSTDDGGMKLRKNTEEKQKNQITLFDYDVNPRINDFITRHISPSIYTWFIFALYFLISK